MRFYCKRNFSLRCLYTPTSVSSLKGMENGEAHVRFLKVNEKADNYIDICMTKNRKAITPFSNGVKNCEGDSRNDIFVNLIEKVTHRSVQRHSAIALMEMIGRQWK